MSVIPISTDYYVHDFDIPGTKGDVFGVTANGTSTAFSGLLGARPMQCPHDSLQRMTLAARYQWTPVIPGQARSIQIPYQGTELAQQRERPWWATSFTRNIPQTVAACIPGQGVISGHGETAETDSWPLAIKPAAQK